jgi:hypothetical protein
MTEALVDDSGYPRQDLDVYQVRHARHKIICKQLRLVCFWSVLFVFPYESHGVLPAELHWKFKFFTLREVWMEFGKRHPKHFKQMSIQVFRDVTLCCLANNCYCFEGSWHCHVQRSSLPEALKTNVTCLQDVRYHLTSGTALHSGPESWITPLWKHHDLYLVVAAQNIQMF